MLSAAVSTCPYGSATLAARGRGRGLVEGKKKKKRVSQQVSDLYLPNEKCGGHFFEGRVCVSLKLDGEGKNSFEVVCSGGLSNMEVEVVFPRVCGAFYQVGSYFNV